MIKLRLFSKGGNPKDDVIEDIEFPEVPSVGDTICLEYGAGHEPVYRVLSRRFFVLCTEAETKGKFDRVGIEVEEIPASAGKYTKLTF